MMAERRLSVVLLSASLVLAEIRLPDPTVRRITSDRCLKG